MGRYEIVCVKHDPNEVITHVGAKELGVLTTQQAVEKLLKEIDTFYTKKNGKIAEVHPKYRSDTKRWYLTTEPDSENENNLDFLSCCE